MITKFDDQSMRSPIMNVSFRNGDTVMVAEKDAEYEDMKGWKIGTVMETKDDDNIVREFANVRIRLRITQYWYTSQIVLLQQMNLIKL